MLTQNTDFCKFGENRFRSLDTRGYGHTDIL